MPQKWTPLSLRGAAAILFVLGGCEGGGGMASATGPESGEATASSGGESASATGSTGVDPTEATEATAGTEASDAGTDTVGTTGADETSDGAVSCGDGVIADDEVCDGAALGEQSCASQGYAEGTLTCTASCTLDVGGCIGCSDWIHQLGTYHVDSGSALALDAAGNVYVVGATRADLDGNALVGGSDAFVAKYTPAGVKLWTRTLGSTADEGAMGVAVDSTGAIYVVGGTEGSLDGDAFAGFIDIFVAKLDPEGEALWTRQYGTPIGESAHGVAIDGLDNVYVVGSTAGDLEGNTLVGGSDAFITRFDAAGDRIWTRLLGTSEEDGADAVAIDANGDIVLVGGTRGALEGGGFGGYDAFVAKFDGDGTNLWTRQFGTAAGESANAVDVDADGDALITGSTSGKLGAEPALGGLDVFVARFAGDGTPLSTRQFGTDDDDFAYGVSVTSDGGYYVVGGTRGVLPGNVSQGLIDAYVVRHAKSGAEVWAKQFGGENIEHLSGSAVDAADNLYAAGSARLDILGTENAGADDMLVIRLCGE